MATPLDTTPHFVDIHVGKRLRNKRNICGLSQDSLAEQLNITFQQIQKYERGANRISASRLFDASQALEEPVSYFFQGLPGQVIGSDLESKNELISNYADYAMERETLDLLKLFYQIKSPILRKRLKALLKTVISSELS